MKNLFGLSVLLLLVGCGGPDEVNENKELQTILADIGGNVVYALDATEGLSGVTVTVTAMDGTATTATTDTNGIWFMENLSPGTYLEEFSFAGYQTLTRPFAIEAEGENDVANIYVSRGQAALTETGITAAISGAFDIPLLENTDELIDGVLGTVAEYSMASGGDIVVTLDKPATPQLNFEVFAEDTIGTVVIATPNGSRTVFTISEADIQGTLTEDGDPFTVSPIFINVTSFTDIHGDVTSLFATVRFNLRP